MDGTGLYSMQQDYLAVYGGAWSQFRALALGTNKRKAPTRAAALYCTIDL